jgi:signal transduction histidine kinase
MLEIAVANTDRLIRLINDFLDLERLQSGNVELQPARCSTVDLVERATDGMRTLAQTAGVELRSEPTRAMLTADPDRIVQVLTNLLSNAVKFSSPGSVVRIWSEARGDDVLFLVQDVGRGIPAHKLEAIFGRFQQLDPSDARQRGGTGLGLAICRSIVEQHGGRIWVESTPGQGSTLKVLLPAHFAGCHQPPCPEANAAHPSSGTDDASSASLSPSGTWPEEGHDATPHAANGSTGRDPADHAVRHS